MRQKDRRHTELPYHGISNTLIVPSTLDGSTQLIPWHWLQAALYVVSLLMTVDGPLSAPNIFLYI